MNGMAIAPGTRRYPIRAYVGLGSFCWTTQGPLDAYPGCPGSAPPIDDGKWHGRAVVTIDGSAEQVYVNIARDGAAFDAVVVGVAPPATQDPGPS
jgi:hypothetical protein